MPYITREDGERFVIPSYRDVVSAKKQSLLKKEVLSLSSIYGEYVTLQRKNIEQYEIACSPDAGYLLGETVWHYFKRPFDLIYCEVIPNTSEAILVVVKSGSVYLDGNFPLDAIADELVIFRTQQNNFDIYLYGDVPISQTAETGKISFEANAVKSFTQLDRPIFPLLPKIKAFQLQRVDTVLAIQGIGVLPIKKIAAILGILILIWVAYRYISSHKEVLPVAIGGGTTNPYQDYIASLNAPDPSVELNEVYVELNDLFTLPGWIPTKLDYSKGSFRVGVQSPGASTELLYAWASHRKLHTTVEVAQDGFYLNWSTHFTGRSTTQSIYEIGQIISAVVDRVAQVLPGENNLQIGSRLSKTVYVQTPITINFTNITPGEFLLLGQKLQNLPLVLSKTSMVISNGKLTGTISLQALGY